MQHCSHFSSVCMYLIELYLYVCRYDSSWLVGTNKPNKLVSGGIIYVDQNLDINVRMFNEFCAMYVFKYIILTYSII